MTENDERQPLLGGGHDSPSPTSINHPEDATPYYPIKPSKPNPDNSGPTTNNALISAVGLESVEERFRLHRQGEYERMQGPDSSPVDARSRLASVGNGASLQWNGLTVALPPKAPSLMKRLCGGNDDDAGEAKFILRNVTGEVRPEQLLAVMGASGAGKTTLMNVLSSRNLGGLQVVGEVLLNGEEADEDLIRGVSAYVQQEDLFIGTLTVREHLQFQALLRMCKRYTKDERLERVEVVLQEIGLMGVADSKIGDPIRIRGISGGERKRLAFASEVLTDPPLLFVDEPTSGLDSFMAQSVVHTLKTLAAKGRTIVCTIHQPASEVYAMFDRIMLLAEGETAFLGSSEDALSFFRDLGHDCPTNFNPADFFVHKLAVVPKREEESRRDIKMITSAFAERQSENLKGGNRRQSLGGSVLTSRDMESWFTQMRVILYRTFLSFIRDPGLIRVRLVQTLFTAIIAGIVYLHMSGDQTRIQNSVGILFFMVTNQVFNPLFSVLQVFPLELPLFFRDHGNRMYQTNVYVLSKMVTELPFNIILAFVYTSVVYWMVGLNSDLYRYGFCCLVIIGVTLCSISLSYFVSSISPSIQVAIAIAPMIIMPFLLFGGLFINIKQLPGYLEWIPLISYIKYGFEALVINEWHDVIPQYRVNGTLEDCTPQVCKFFNSTEIVEFYGFKDDMSHAHWNFYYVLIWMAVVRLLAYICLEIKVYRASRR